MKKVGFIIALIIGFQMQAFSSHVLGGEITYRHESDSKFKVFVTIYRDCSECKLAGEGGGPVANDCGKFDLHLRTSDKNECSSTYIRKFALTRESIEQILPVCNSVSSLCDNEQNSISKGIEAHTFSTTIDFEDYKSSSSCGFELYISLSARAKNIDNLSNGGQPLFNYAYINPFVTHSSPSFSSNPPMILQVNQPVRTVMAGADNSIGDSVEVRFATPLKGFNLNIAYNSSYSRVRPLTVWCPDTDCKPKPQNKIPIGMYLGNDGSMVFTPVSNGEKATVVIEIRKWRRVQGKATLVSIVRRDIQMEVTSLASGNHAPELVGTSLGAGQAIDVCLGEQLCFDIQAKDQPFTFSDGTYQRQNTVVYDWETDITSASISQRKTSNAPYNKLAFCWKPKSSDVGREFHIDVTAIDDNCPIRATNTTRYTIRVHEAPKTDFSVTKLWCGNVELGVKSQNGEILSKANWELYNEQGDLYAQSIQLTDTIGLFSQGDYHLKGQVVNTDGCKVRFESDVKILEKDLSEEFGSFVGKQDWCLGDTIELMASTTQKVRWLNSYWLSGDDTLAVGSGLKHRLGGSDNQIKIDLHILGERDKLKCYDHLSIPLKIHLGPTVTYDDNFAFCLNDPVIDLNALVNRGTGTWSGIDHDATTGSQMDPTQLGSHIDPVKVCNEYTSIDKISGCTSIDTFCSWAFPLPDLEMKNTVVCGTSGYFNLYNTCNHNSFSNLDIKWYLDDLRVFTIDGNPGLVELASIPYGKHEIKIVLTNEFGCTVKDSTTLERLDELVLSNISKAEICQGDDVSLMDLFNISVSGGIWNSTSHLNAVHGNELSDTVCGNLQLNYTYDRFGCFASADFTLDVECRPEVELIYNDTLCASWAEVQIGVSPNLGYFRGDEMIDAFLQIDKGNREYSFEYVVQRGNCEFIYPGNIWVAPAPQYEVLPEPSGEICEGEIITVDRLSIEHGEMSWSTSEDVLRLKEGSIDDLIYVPTPTEIAAGQATFKMEVTGIGDCPAIDVDFVTTIHPKAYVSLNQQVYAGCEPFTFKPDVFQQHNNVDWKKTNIEWNLGTGDEVQNDLTPKHTYTSPGKYTVTVRTESQFGCEFEQKWPELVEVYATPQAGFRSVPDGYISIRNPRVEFKNLSTCQDAMTYLWDFGTGNPEDVSNLTSPIFTFEADTGRHLVSLYAETSNGCFDEATSVIWVGPDIQIFVPNAFSPDLKGPDVNNEFQVIGNNVKTYHIEIFNRWGNRVYSSDNINDNWDGQVRSKVCPTGVYAYTIKATSMSGEEYDLKGTLNLIR